MNLLKAKIKKLNNNKKALMRLFYFMYMTLAKLYSSPFTIYS